MAGLSMLLAGARRTSRRGREARRGLAQSRRETAAVSADRDDLIGQRDTARAYTASTLGNGDGPPRNGSDPGPRGPSLSGRLFARRRSPAGRPAASAAGQPGRRGPRRPDPRQRVRARGMTPERQPP